MSRARVIFEHHLVHLRQEAAVKGLSFSTILRAAIKNEAKKKVAKEYLLADALKQTESEPTRLIEMYRMEFYEWLANLAMKTTETDIEASSIKKANQMISARDSEKARKAAGALHDRPDGSRAKRQAIQEIWASGKYSTRNICAEEECGALGMSLKTARNALINTPDPKRPPRC